MDSDDYFDVDIVAFGTHTQKRFGHTIDAIKKDGFTISHTVELDLESDNPSGISKNMGQVMEAFSSIWQEKSDTDLIICLGDRYEMFAAVTASVPFSIPIAHFHGGETTLGAMDEVFRHSMTAMATYHFTSAEIHRERVAQLKGTKENIENIGLLSLENLKETPLYSEEEFKEHCGVDLSVSTVLFTFHPETVKSNQNREFAKVLGATLSDLSSKYQILITMPNADTANHYLRQAFTQLETKNKKVVCVESLGMRGYFSAMKHCKIMLGNTSSGISEAATFGKYVINLGDRQKGRARSENVFDCIINNSEIVKKVSEVITLGDYDGRNIFEQPNGVSKVILKLKSI
jgi:GDP/UDP-N,N'-diacetylbacillosamine 2-epimerase (hydrolysing)